MKFRTRLALVAMATLLTACSATPQTTATASPAAEPGDLVGQLKAEPFGQTSVDAAVAILAQSGIGTYADPTATAPMVPVTGPDMGLKLLNDQVRSIALEAHHGGGTIGAEIDSIVDTAPDLAPPSYILAGYVAAADTPGSLAARKIMGVEDWTAEDWRDAPSVVYPGIVMTLFTADVVSERESEAAADTSDGFLAAAGPMPDLQRSTLVQAPQDSEGLCTAISHFISNALKTIFDKLRLGEPKRGALLVLVKIWNFAVTILETVITTIVKKFEQKVLDQIGRVAAIVGVIGSVISLVRPWTVGVQQEPGVREKGIAGIRPVEEGALVARYVQLDEGPNEWPGWAVDCARKAGRPLPNLKPEGSAITWSSVKQTPPALITPGAKSATLNADGAAELNFVTQMDNVHDPYDTVAGKTAVEVTVNSHAMQDLANWVRTQIYSEIPYQVGGPLASFLNPYLERIKAKLEDLLSKHGSTTGTILYHVQLEATPPPPGERKPCLVRPCAESNGDPHIVTLDASGYDFQAVGEFVLLRTADASFELQARQEAWFGSESVSYNTALGLKVGSQRLGIYADPASPQLRATLDGQPLDTTQPVDLPTGAHLTADWAGYQIDFPDGTVFYALSTDGPHGINVLIEPSAALAQSGTGLMGPIGAESDLPALPNGTELPEPTSTDEFNQQLYGQFADAWRVTSATSLFEYAAGTSTETFTNRAFPQPEKILTIDDLTPEQRAAGEEACKNVPLQPFHDHCVFDVGITGDTLFAQIYDVTVNVVETGSLKPGGEYVRVVNLYTNNEAGPTALDIYSWTDAGPALVTTVEFGRASEWFDPGLTGDALGSVGNRISAQRHGEAILEAGLNLVELVRDANPGAERTVLIRSDDPASITWAGGRAATVEESLEVASSGFPLAAPPEGSALLFVNTSPIQYEQEGVSFFVGDGDRCLTQPDLPTLAQTVGYGGDETPLALDLGEQSITLLPATGNEDPFTYRCDTPSITSPAPLNAQDGDRFHLFVYTDPASGLLDTLLLPLGRQ